MKALSAANLFDRDRSARFANGVVVAIAVSLPWSTSATSILIAVWLIALLPTLNLADIRREVATPAGGLPVALFGVAALGMLWADVAPIERLDALEAFLSVLIIPLVIAQFRRSGRGMPVFSGFLAACLVLLIASYIVAVWPDLPMRRSRDFGVVVKNYITQSAEFTICAFVMLFIAVREWQTGRRGLALAALLLAAAFLIDIFYVVSSRTAFIVIPALFLVYGLRNFGLKGLAGGILAAVVLIAITWVSSTYMRARVINAIDEIKAYQSEDAMTPAGERIEFWKKSIQFISKSPAIGNGTGSVNEMFRRAATGVTGASSEISNDPHNQTFEIGIQLGLLGIGLLWAMWIAHLLSLKGGGLAAWIGVVIVTQNIVSSVFNSHLFDFTEGWIYAFGYGVAAGMVRHVNDRED